MQGFFLYALFLKCSLTKGNLFLYVLRLLSASELRADTGKYMIFSVDLWILYLYGLVSDRFASGSETCFRIVGFSRSLTLRSQGY